MRSSGKNRVSKVLEQEHAVIRNSTNRIHFTRAYNLIPFVKVLDSLGAPTMRLLQDAHIQPELITEPEALVPLEFAYRFAELIAQSQGIDDLGLFIGQQISAFELGLFGKNLQHSLTVYEYLHTGIRMIGSSTSGSRFWLTREGNQVRFNYHSPGNRTSGRYQGDLYTLTITINMLRRFTSEQWCPDEICLLADQESILGDRAFFGDSRVILNQPFTSFTIPLSLLQRSIPRSILPDENLKKKPDDSPQMPEDFVGSLERLVETMFWEGRPDIDLVAEISGMSKRTLQRRLACSGLTYSNLLNRTRLDIAAELLVDTDMTISEIAKRLGYTDPANFTRAFRARTGIAPLFYRRNAPA